MFTDQLLSGLKKKKKTFSKILATAEISDIGR